jgi:hypothetical protein
MIKIIRDNYKIYGLIIVKIAKQIANVTLWTLKCHFWNHLTMFLPCNLYELFTHPNQLTWHWHFVIDFTTKQCSLIIYIYLKNIYDLNIYKKVHIITPMAYEPISKL